MPKIEAFEKHSNEYDKWFDDNPELYTAELTAIRQLMPAAGAKGLEVGVGSGKFAALLEIKTGVEPSEKMAAKARLLGIEVHTGVAEKLPFVDETFDLVLMVTTICFVNDVTKSLSEAYRVLKTGGCFIIGFVDSESEIGKQYAAKKADSKFYKDATFYSASEVLDHLEESDFEVTDTLQTLVPGKPSKTILEGHGKGSFVVIKAIKTTNLNK